MTSRRRRVTWAEDTRGGLRSVLLEGLIVVAFAVVAVVIAWAAVTVI